jgi:hypothetical protein
VGTAKASEAKQSEAKQRTGMVQPRGSRIRSPGTMSVLCTQTTSQISKKRRDTGAMAGREGSREKQKGSRGEAYDSTVICLPPRMTSQRGACRAARASSAAPARLSWVTPKMAFAITMMIITILEAYSPNAAAMILHNTKQYKHARH